MTAGQVAGALFVAVLLIGLVGVLAVAGRDDDGGRQVIARLAGGGLVIGFSIVPILLPAVLSRKGFLSIGRWLAAAGFFLALALSCGFFLWVLAESRMEERAGPLVFLFVLVLVLSILAIPGCLLAAVVYPKEQPD